MIGLQGKGDGYKSKISNTLKKRWQDPEFREKMMKAMKKRNLSTLSTKKQRQKISDAIKKKWQDEDYRQRAMKGMEESRIKRAPIKKKTSKKTTVLKSDTVVAVKPVLAKKRIIKKKTKRVTSRRKKASTQLFKETRSLLRGSVEKKKTKRKTKIKKASASSDVMDESVSPSDKKKKSTPKKDGDISRMREERRDLYDLLYGDETSSGKKNELVVNGAGKLLDDDDQGGSLLLEKPTSLSFFSDSATLDDENLDDYDPYGLDD